MNYKDFFPPIAINIAKKMLNKNEKYYNSFEEAKKAISGEGYNNKELCQMICDKTIIYKDSFQKPFKINPTYLFLSGVLAKCYSEQENKNISVLDFGGSCGAVYFDIRSFLGDKIELNWDVVDLPEMIESAKSHNLENKELKFYDDLEKTSGKYDLIHSSSTLHYVENINEVITKLLNFNTKYILFNRMLFNDTENDKYTVQHSAYHGFGPGKLPNGYIDKKIGFPVRIMSFKKFSSILEKQYNLECIFSIEKKVNGIVEQGLLYKNKTYI